MRKSLGIIGGSGLYNINNLQIIKSHEITTPWGDPSNSIVELNYNDETLFFLPRHGKNHHISPSKINYRANIDALKQLGVTDILSISSVGSLKETLQPGSFVIVDQFIDLTKCRVSSFFDADIVVHVSMAHPTDKALMDIVDLSLDNISINYKRGGVYVCIEGPQFSTLSESNLYRSWDCDVIGMTNMPEAKLCREASLRYATVGMITDYDCWHPAHDNVEVSNVMDMLHKNTLIAQEFILKFISHYSSSSINSKLNSFDCLVTPINKIKKDTKHKLKHILPELLKN